MKITIITEWYNEGLLAPFFLNHYKYVDEIIILLEEDTNDNTREICDMYPNVVIEYVHCPTGLDDKLKVEDINRTISKVKEGWIYVLDPDEFIFPDKHEDVQTFLSRQDSDIIMSHCWNVFKHHTDSDLDPTKETLHQRLHGNPFIDRWRKKPSVLRAPSSVTLQPGNHVTVSKDHSYSNEIYRGVHWNMVDLNFSINRRISQKRRMSDTNLTKKYGIHNHKITVDELTKECELHLNDPLLPIMEK
jgi:hypothetical protein